MVEAILIYVVLGVVTGLLSGMLGLGGGVIVVPGLYIILTLLKFPPQLVMHMAIACSLAVMLFTAASSVRGHHVRKNLRYELYRKFIVVNMLAVIGGILLTLVLSTQILVILFSLYLFYSGIKMLLGAQRHGAEHESTPAWWQLNATGAATGLLSGLIGIGGGTVIVPVLSRFIPVQQAAGIGAMNAFCTAIVGTLTWVVLSHVDANLTQHGIHYIYWPAVIAVAIPSFIFARVGVKAAYKLPVPVLKRIFGVVVILIGLKMIL